MSDPNKDWLEAELEKLEQRLTSDALHTRGFFVETHELALEDTVDTTGLLLFAQLAQVLGPIAAAAVATLLTRRIRALLNRTLR